MTIQDVVLSIVSEKSKRQDINESTNIFGLKILDSFSVLEVIFSLEERFEIKFAQDDLLPQNFETPAKIAELIETVLAKQ